MTMRASGLLGLFHRLTAPAALAVASLLLSLLAVSPAPAGDNCPDPAAAPTTEPITLTARFRTVQHRLQTGGHVSLSDCLDRRSRGFVQTAPGLTLDIPANQRRRDLRIEVSGRCNPFILLHDPGGDWHDSRQTEDDDPRALVLVAPGRGEYGVWVGNGFGRCDGEITLTMTQNR